MLTKPQKTPGIVNLVVVALLSLYFMFKIYVAWMANAQADVFIWLGLLFMATGISVYLYRVLVWDGVGAKEGSEGHGH